MSTKHIISTINVILTLLVTFSTQLNYNESDTYQDLNEWSLETNLLEFHDDSNEQLLAFSEFNLPSHINSVFFLFSFLLTFIRPSIFSHHRQPTTPTHSSIQCFEWKFFVFLSLFVRQKLTSRRVSSIFF